MLPVQEWAPRFRFRNSTGLCGDFTDGSTKLHLCLQSPDRSCNLFSIKGSVLFHYAANAMKSGNSVCRFQFGDGPWTWTTFEPEPQTFSITTPWAIPISFSPSPSIV